MPKKKATRKMTEREKRERAETRAYMREMGFIPPVKKPVNRTKYAQKIVSTFKRTISDDQIRSHFETMQAVVLMAPFEDDLKRKGRRKVTDEQIGVLKVMHLVIRSMEYRKANATATDGQWFEEVWEPVQGMKGWENL